LRYLKFDEIEQKSLFKNEKLIALNEFILYTKAVTKSKNVMINRALNKIIKIGTFSFFTIFSMVIVSCDSDVEAQVPEPEVTLGYEQYGTPFQNVPDSEDAIIYQINLRSFNEGTIRGAQKRLDSVKKIGINVIYLMPIFPSGQIRSAGGLGSPYSVKNYKEISPDFGTLDDLRSFVAEAHKRDMAVILDWIANHTSWDNEWITKHPDWYQQDENGTIIIPPGTNYQDVAQLQYNNPELQNAMIDAMSYWVYNANIDGFRCDFADFVPQSFWSDAIQKIKSIKDQKMLLLAEGSKKEHYTVGFDYIFGFSYFDTLKEVFEAGKSVKTIQEQNNRDYADVTQESARVVRYTSNHDVNSYEGTPLELFGGKKGSLATFVVAAYMKTVPMVYNGQEIGYTNRIDFFDNKSINWNLADYQMLQTYKDIISFRNSSNALKRGAFTGFSSDDVCVFTMELGEEKVLVLANLRNKTVKYMLPASLLNSTWGDAFSTNSITLAEQVDLNPFQYLVLKNL
jgi:glycosidase